MHDLFKIFISLPVGARLALIFGIIFLVWLILAKPLLKIFSILPWIIKKIFYCLYFCLKFLLVYCTVNLVVCLGL